MNKEKYLTETEKNTIAYAILFLVGFVVIGMMIAFVPVFLLIIVICSISIPATVWSLNRVLK